MKPHFRDSMLPMHEPATLATPSARKLNSAYEELFDQLIQGKHLTVPCAYVNILSLRTQFNRWRAKLPAELGLASKMIDSIDVADSAHVILFLRDKKVKKPIPYTLLAGLPDL